MGGLKNVLSALSRWVSVRVPSYTYLSNRLVLFTTDESFERSRERREQRVMKKKLAVEAKTQSQITGDSDRFMFGPADDFIEPTYTGSKPSISVFDSCGLNIFAGR